MRCVKEIWAEVKAESTKIGLHPDSVMLCRVIALLEELVQRKVKKE